VSKLKEEIIALKEVNELKEGQIQGCIRRIKELSDNMRDKPCQVLIAEKSRKGYSEMHFVIISLTLQCLSVDMFEMCLPLMQDEI
jgi:hypothetical protein